MKSPSILGKFNVKPRRNPASVCYCVFNLRESNVVRTLTLRWLEIVSSSHILMSRYDHTLSLDATIMVSKNCPTIG